MLFMYQVCTLVHTCVFKKLYHVICMPCSQGIISQLSSILEQTPALVTYMLRVRSMYKKYTFRT
jgi:hypothetical protein